MSDRLALAYHILQYCLKEKNIPKSVIKQEEGVAEQKPTERLKPEDKDISKKPLKNLEHSVQSR